MYACVYMHIYTYTHTHDASEQPYAPAACSQDGSEVLMDVNLIK